MHTPEPPHRAALGVCLVAAFLLLIGIGPIAASRIGNTADASELHTATDSTAASTTSSSTPSTTTPGPTPEEVAAAELAAAAADAATTSTAPPTTSTTQAPAPPPPPPPAPEPEPEPAPPSSAYPARTDIPDSYWDRMAQCETGGNWGHYPGARWSGGLGIYTPGWLSFGGGEFAPSAGEASREQQIVVANRIAAVGLGGWGCLSSIGYP